MRADELRRALDDLAGDPPPVDDAFRVVAGRVRRQRRRVRVAVAAVSVVVITSATVGTLQVRSHSHHVSVVSPSPPTGDTTDLAWSRIAAQFDVRRVVTANGQTFAVGSSGGVQRIAELDTNGAPTGVNPAASYEPPVRGGSVNDLVGVPGTLVAVGQSNSAVDGSPYADAWRSTDGGHAWQSARVQTTPEGTPLPTMSRVVVSQGVFYAMGSRSDPNTGLHCPIYIWRSTNGYDFHLLPGRITCAGGPDVAAGPAGLVVTTSDNATVWHRSGDEWSPRSISRETNPHVFAVVGSDRGYVAVGSTGGLQRGLTGAIWWSPDGATWARVATATAPADPTYEQAQILAVAHSSAGWIATGWQLHPGGDPLATDAVVWTSPDGERWTENTRDAGTFEQHARASGVGVTGGGFAISGTANITGTGNPDVPTRQDNVLWLGSNTPAGTPPGIIEGTMREVGGPPPGIDRGVSGTITATPSDGTQVTAPVDAGGEFSTRVALGTYTIVGHSPLYGSGSYDCGANGPITVAAGAVAHVDLVCNIR